MSITLRILLLVAALVTAVWILRKISRLKVKMEDAIFWIVFAGILCVLALFPEFCYWLTGVLGMISPANLIFLVVIFLMIEKVFTLSIIVSQLEEKIEILSAELALRNHSAEKRLDAGEKAEEREVVQEKDPAFQKESSDSGEQSMEQKRKMEF